MPDSIILTIAIPTFNRRKYLAECLESIIPQLCEGVEVLISDNASTDGTIDLVNSMSARTRAIRYNRNATNIGPDGNFLVCLREARGKYVHLVSDDDLLLPGGLSQILDRLNASPDIGFLCLNHISGFTGKFNVENCSQPVFSNKKDIVTHDKGLAIESIGVYLSFLSILVFRRDTVLSIHAPERFLGTNLLQAHLAISTFGSGRRVGILAAPVIAARGGNSGGYDIFRVFAYEWKRVLFTTGIRAGIPYRSLQRTFSRTIRTHLRYWTFVFRSAKSGYSIRRVDLLFRATASYPISWILLYPIVLMPKRVLRFLQQLL